MKTIGILGGIGPSASASMYSRIISYMQNEYEAWEDDDFPPIMVYSISLEGFDEKGIADPKKAEENLVNAVKKLEQMGCDMIVIACNTVHYFDKQLEQTLSIPLVHMIAEACADVKKHGFTKVGIACSHSTRDLKLYSDGLSELSIEPVVATDEEQEVIDKAIVDVMAGKQDAQTTKNLNQVFDRYRADGAEAVVLGCTELPLAIQQKDAVIKILDANDIVVKEAVKLARQ